MLSRGEVSVPGYSALRKRPFGVAVCGPIPQLACMSTLVTYSPLALIWSPKIPVLNNKSTICLLT